MGVEWCQDVAKMRYFRAMMNRLRDKSEEITDSLGENGNIIAVEVMFALASK